eukprot:6212856-Pleurochrysis_carterae.AAC.4
MVVPDARGFVMADPNSHSVLINKAGRAPPIKARASCWHCLIGKLAVTGLWIDRKHSMRTERIRHKQLVVVHKRQPVALAVRAVLVLKFHFLERRSQVGQPNILARMCTVADEHRHALPSQSDATGIFSIQDSVPKGGTAC